MQRFFDILAVVLPVIGALGLGWFSRRRSLLTPEGIAGLKALVMNFCLPATLFSAFYHADFDRTLGVVAGAVIVSCVAALGIGFLVLRIFPGQSPMLPYLCTGFEAGMMGYGLYAMLFGTDNLHYFAMADLGQVVFVFTIYMALLNRQKGLGIRDTLLAMVRSPVFLAIMLGVFLGITGLGARLHQGPVGPAVAQLLSYIGAPTGMVMIFVVGYGLRWERAAARGALFAAACRLLVMAALCAVSIAVVRLLVPMDDRLLWAMVLLFSLSAPFVLPVFTDADEATVSTNLSLYALFSIAVFAVISVLK